MELIFKDYCLQYVFYVVVYKYVFMMEDNVFEVIQVNVLGICIMVDLVVKYGVEKFVMVFMDKVVNLINVMGCSKRFVEIYVQFFVY